VRVRLRRYLGRRHAPSHGGRRPDRLPRRVRRQDAGGVGRRERALRRLHGQRLARPQLLAAKRDYADRWPVRVYTARPDSLHPFCNAAATCAVAGTVDWDCRNPQRGTRSVGTAHFILTVRLAGNGVRILAEAGSAIAREAR
jgi:hypothetical protein